MGKNTVFLTILASVLTIIAMDFSLASIALPAIERNLHIDSIVSHWVLTADLLAYGGFLIVGGKLSDLYGQKRILLAGLLAFMLGAGVTCISNTSEVFIPARALQGFGAALAYPAAVSLLMIHYEAGPEKLRALTICAVAQIIGIPVGTVISGHFVTRYGGHAAFLLEFILCLTMLITIPFALPAQKKIAFTGVSIPVFEAGLLSVGMASLIYSSLSFFSRNPNGTSLTPYTMSVGVVALAAFIATQKVSKTPLVPMSLLKTRNLIGGAIVTALISLAGKGLVALSNLSLQRGLGHTAQEASLALIPMAISSLLIVLPLSWRFGPHLLARVKVFLIVALIMLGAMHFVLSLVPQDSALIAILVILLTAPIAITNGANLGLGETLREVSAEQQGLASALLFTVVQVLNAIGTALLIVVSSQPDIHGFAQFRPGFRLAAGIAICGALIALPIIRRTGPAMEEKTRYQAPVDDADLSVP